MVLVMVLCALGAVIGFRYGAWIGQNIAQVIDGIMLIAVVAVVLIFIFRNSW
jgi:alpha/beta superfamily hydrolase